MKGKLFAPCLFLSLLLTESGCGPQAFTDKVWSSSGSRRVDAPSMASVRLYDLGPDAGYRLEYDAIALNESRDAIKTRKRVVKQLPQAI